MVVRREVMEELLKDPEYRRRLEEAETMEEVERVFEEFCRRRGFRFWRMR